jgi:hypothetical protein
VLQGLSMWPALRRKLPHRSSTISSAIVGGAVQVASSINFQTTIRVENSVVKKVEVLVLNVSRIHESAIKDKDRLRAAFCLPQLSQPQRPGHNARDFQQAHAVPGVGREPLPNLFRRSRLKDEQDFIRALQRAAQHDEPFIHKRVHELGVRVPLHLVFQAEAGLVRCSADEHHGIELVHGEKLYGRGCSHSQVLIVIQTTPSFRCLSR